MTGVRLKYPIGSCLMLIARGVLQGEKDAGCIIHGH